MSSADGRTTSDNVHRSATGPLGHIVEILPRSLSSGFASGVVASTISQPLSVVLTRFESGRGLYSQEARRRRSIVLAVREIARNEGIAALWRGGVVGVLRSGLGAPVYFSGIAVGRDLLRDDATGIMASSHSLALGIVARSVSVVLTAPLLVHKTRLESGSIRQGFGSFAREATRGAHGARGLFIGLPATLARDAPYAGVMFTCYERLLEPIARLTSQAHVEWAAPFLAGGVASMCASTITHPADVLRTHAMLDRLGPVGVVQKHGWSSLFHGLWTRIVRKSVISGVAWLIFESGVRQPRDTGGRGGANTHENDR